ncbi:hypothetical protein [Prauserella alba]|nr:hypothetical protein [Prauserella alba]
MSDWYTPEARDAERECDRVIEDAAETIRETDELLEEFREDMVVTQEEIDSFRALVEGRCRTPEWDAVISRINHGELNWKQLLEGKYSADSEVVAAFASLRSIEPLPATSEHEADDYRAPDPTGDRNGRGTHENNAPTDDEYFDEMDIFGRR